MTIRLQKFLSQSGVASRRKAEELIAAGKVTVNGKRVTQLGTQINPDEDKVCVQGKTAQPSSEKYYYLLNKPKGVIVSKSDPQKRKTVYQLIPNLHPSVNAVGRLDYDSEGLLLLTNDGEFAHMLMHPSSEIEKVYEVQVHEMLDPEAREELLQGIELEEGLTAPCKIEELKKGKSEIWYSMTIHEGKKRQVRNMFAWAGLKVLRLIRVKVGPFSLSQLKNKPYLLLKSIPEQFC